MNRVLRQTMRGKNFNSELCAVFKLGTAIIYKGKARKKHCGTSGKVQKCVKVIRKLVLPGIS